MITQCAEADVVGRLYELSGTIVNGATLEESLDFIFDSFQDLIPYDRIGFAEIDPEGETARSKWSKSKQQVLLRNGFSAPLKGSSLSIVMQYRQPRVLNNLPKYLSHRPNSRSTSLIVREGIKSSMTCPLFVKDKPLGFLFFSSNKYASYDESHVNLMKEIAMHLAMLLMASQQIVPSEHSRQYKHTPIQEPRDLMLSQLKPGMGLVEPIRAEDGTLLLAAGTQLSDQSINRMVTLHQQGVLTINSVRIR